jgi:hypothetical protein
VSVSSHHSTIMRAERREKMIRWCESDVPWSRLNDEGETESEGIDDCDEDDDQDD